MPEVVDRLLHVGCGYRPVLGALLEVEIIAGGAGLICFVIGQRAVQTQADSKRRHVLMLRDIVDVRVCSGRRHIVGTHIGGVAGAGPQVGMIVIVGHVGQRIGRLLGIQRWPRYPGCAIEIACAGIIVVPVSVCGEYREVFLAGILDGIGICRTGALVHLSDRVQRSAQRRAAEREGGI